MDLRLSKIIQKHLGYSDEEMREFLKNPRNKDFLARQKELKDKVIVLEVVKSRGCNSLHKVGDKICFDAFGNILTEKSPGRICSYALNSALMMVFAANELLYAGVDPEKMQFKRSSCFDVGVECGGIGNIVLELSVEEKEKSKHFLRK